MGNPVYGTPAWHKKLKATKFAKQNRSLQKLARSPKGLRLIRAATEKLAAKRKQCEQELEKQTLKANKYYRGLGHLRTKAASLEAVVVKMKDQADRGRLERRRVDEENAQLRKRLKKAEKQVDLWLLFWGWVQAHSRPKTLEWLQRLWKRGPRPAPDRCWGGGQ